jgi:hypothetical protein
VSSLPGKMHTRPRWAGWIQCQIQCQIRGFEGIGGDGIA